MYVKLSFIRNRFPHFLNVMYSKRIIHYQPAASWPTVISCLLYKMIILCMKQLQEEIQISYEPFPDHYYTNSTRSSPDRGIVLLA